MTKREVEVGDTVKLNIARHRASYKYPFPQVEYPYWLDNRMRFIVLKIVVEPNGAKRVHLHRRARPDVMISTSYENVKRTKKGRMR